VFIFLRSGVVSPPPNPEAGGPPLVGCPRLLIQYIRSCPPYLEAFSSIRNLKTRHAVVTRDPLSVHNVNKVFVTMLLKIKLYLYFKSEPLIIQSTKIMNHERLPITKHLIKFWKPISVLLPLLNSSFGGTDVSISCVLRDFALATEEIIAEAVPRYK
jgi:hypothetical protein